MLDYFPNYKPAQNVLNNRAAGKAKSIEKQKEETRQDNQDIAGQKKEQKEFFVGMGLGQGNKKAEVESGAKAPRPQEENVFDMIGNYYVESREKEENNLENAEMQEQYINNDYRPPAQRAKQNISNSIGEKAGATEDVFDLIAKEFEKSLLRERENEERRWEGFGSFFAKPDSITTQNQANKFTLGSGSKTAEEALWNRADAMARTAGVKQSVLDEIRTEAEGKRGKDIFSESVDSGIVNLAADIVGGGDFILDNILGWENNILSEANDYLQKRADEEYIEAMQAAEATGKGYSAELTANIIMETTEAIPEIILAVMSGGTSKVASLGVKGQNLVKYLKNVTKGLARNPNFWYSVEKSIYPQYEYALKNGATEKEATVTAVLASVMNSTLEATKGFENLSEDLKSANTIGDIVRKWVKSSAMEGLEEVIPGITTEAIQMALFDRDKPLLSFNADKNAAFNLPKMLKDMSIGVAMGLPVGISYLIPALEGFIKK